MIATSFCLKTIETLFQTDPKKFWSDVIKLTSEVRKQMPRREANGMSRLNKMLFQFLGQSVITSLETKKDPLARFFCVMPTIDVAISNLGLCEATGPIPEMSSGPNRYSIALRSRSAQCECRICAMY